jgi:hypothetical protein
MADLKISQLPAATLPLAGTEVLPIVQSGTTKKVAVDNLFPNPITVARGGTGLSTIPTGNVILGNDTSALQVVAPGSNGNVLTSNGSTWTSSAPAGGAGTNTFTASGAITAGRGVALNSNGTASAVSGTLFNTNTAAVVRANSNTNVAASPLGYYGLRATSSNGTWSLAIYSTSNTDINYRAVKITDGTLVDTAAGYSTDASYNYPNYGIFYDAYTQKFMHFTMTDATNNALVCKILTINNTTGAVTVVATLTVFSHSAPTLPGWYQYFTYDTDALGNYIFQFTVYATPAEFTTVAVINLNTNTSSNISFGNGAVPQCTIYDGASSKWIIGYLLSGTTTNNVYTLSGTTLTLVQSNTGVIANLNITNYDLSKGGYLSALGKTILGCDFNTSIAYYVQLVSNVPVITSENFVGFTSSIRYVKAFGQATVSLYSFSTTDSSTCSYNELFYFGSGFVSNGVKNYSIPSTIVVGNTKTVIKLPSEGWVLVCGSVYSTNTCSFAVSTASTSLAWNAVGISTQTVSNGQSVAVTTIGGVNNNVTSLTAGIPTYLNGDGTLSTAVTFAPIGIALSSTSILIKNRA